jgi:hypothetical protein
MKEIDGVLDVWFAVFSVWFQNFVFSGVREELCWAGAPAMVVSCLVVLQGFVCCLSFDF